MQLFQRFSFTKVRKLLFDSNDVLGNTEALAVVRDQLSVLKENRLLTFGIMSMSSVSGSILGAYLSMVPATYIFSAIPLNCINALILANVLNPVEVSKEEDVVYTPSKHEKRISFLLFQTAC